VGVSIEPHGQTSGWTRRPDHAHEVKGGDCVQVCWRLMQVQCDAAKYCVLLSAQWPAQVGHESSHVMRCEHDSMHMRVADIQLSTAHPTRRVHRRGIFTTMYVECPRMHASTLGQQRAHTHTNTHLNANRALELRGVLFRAENKLCWETHGQSVLMLVLSSSLVCECLSHAVPTWSYEDGDKKVTVSTIICPCDVLTDTRCASCMIVPFE
jgi:hypothetical protein